MASDGQRRKALAELQCHWRRILVDAVLGLIILVTAPLWGVIVFLVTTKMVIADAFEWGEEEQKK